MGQQDEAAFRRWYAEKARQGGLSSNPDDPNQFYDYRAAFRANASPDETGHWPSDFKKPGHPNMVVGGFHVQTGERVPGTKQAGYDELVSLGWEPETAKKLSATQDQKVVIVDDAGTRHVFPAGFDPKRAASIVKQQTKPPAPREQGLATIGQQLASKGRNPLVDVGIGAAKGVGNTVFGMGKLVRDYTPIGRISDLIMPGAFDERPQELNPTNTAQRIGFTGEQVGEFFVPLSKVAKLGTAGQVLRSAGQTMAQSGSPVDAGVSGAITAASGPVGRGVSKAINATSKALSTGAEKSVAQALGATKEWAKVDAARLAPEMLKRGVKGSREAMLEQAKEQASNIGHAIDDVIADAAARGTIVDGKVAREAIQQARQALMVPSAAGKPIAIEGAQAALGKLQKLDTFVERLGNAIPIEDAQRVKQAWDKIVSKAGLYGPKATASATDNAEAWAIREAATSFRKLLADASPDLAALNKEFAFWGGLRNVLKETAKRTQAQGGGLSAAISGSAGAAAGLASGDSLGDSLEKAVLGGVAGRQAVKMIQSPWFRTSVSAPLKNALADALASGHSGKILDVMKQISTALPAQMRTAQ
jgi:hypothetical protein